MDIKKKYKGNLKGEDLNKQVESIKKGEDRPKIKGYKSRRSKWSVKANKYFNNNTSKSNMARKLNIPVKAIDEIIEKGEGAYYSSGSRPNVSATQWGRARFYSVLFGGPSRDIDKDIVKKYNIPKLR